MENCLRSRIRVIAGLGNPGKDAERTRHNLGFEVVDFLKGDSRTSGQRREYFRWDIVIASSRIVLLKPTTYMNRSGLAVRLIAEEMNLAPDQILVVADDFNLPLGRIRLRTSGSDGGHNGLASIIYHLGTEDFPRVRLGIGPVSEGVPAEEFVLEQFSREEEPVWREMVSRAAEAIGMWLSEGYEKSASVFNQALSEN